MSPGTKPRPLPRMHRGERTLSTSSTLQCGGGAHSSSRRFSSGGDTNATHRPAHGACRSRVHDLVQLATTWFEAYLTPDSNPNLKARSPGKFLRICCNEEFMCIFNHFVEITVDAHCVRTTRRGLYTAALNVGWLGLGFLA